MSELDAELDGIWIATRRRERRDRVEGILIGVVQMISAVVMAWGFAYVYTRLGGF